jgi:glycosyltransferase involved in cell wall biosynthesis
MIITYNHAKYIARAIDSVVSQDVDFPIAVHIIDDCSTDGAQDIIRDYAARYPGIVKPFINKKNIGRKVTQKNFHRGLLTLDGEYIAILEGDDCWTSRDKLRTQVEFLDANPDFVACAHNAMKTYEDGSKEPHPFPEPPKKDVHDIDDLISLQSFFHTSTLVYRNVFHGKVPRYFRSPVSCDIFITIAHAQFGKVKYLPVDWSLYQVHAGGLFSGMSKTKGWIWNIDGMRKCNGWLGYRYVSQFSKTIYRYAEHMLAHSPPEDNLSRSTRRKYAALAKLYRGVHWAQQRLDLALARYAPGRRKAAAPLKLHLGSGRRKLDGYIDVDISPDVEPDLVWDLERKWPWPDDSAAEVRFIHALEHMGADLDTFLGIMKELYRVCAPGALVVIGAAHPRHDSFVEDPGVVRAITPAVMGQFDAALTQRNAAPSLARRIGVDFEVTARSSTTASSRARRPSAWRRPATTSRATSSSSYASTSRPGPPRPDASPRGHGLAPAKSLDL